MGLLLRKFECDTFARAHTHFLDFEMTLMKIFSTMIFRKRAAWLKRDFVWVTSHTYSCYDTSCQHIKNQEFCGAKLFLKFFNYGDNTDGYAKPLTNIHKEFASELCVFYIFFLPTQVSEKQDKKFCLVSIRLLRIFDYCIKK